MADKMTKGERDELAKLLKMRARLSARVVEQRTAELMADVEAQLAAKYKVNAAAWRELTAAAQLAVRGADAAIAERCRLLGIPEEFRPSLELSWYSRGSNADAERRAELRRVARTRLDAMGKAARVDIETKALDGLTRLAAGALESAEARSFLASMPTVEMLMPALDVATLPIKGLTAAPVASIEASTTTPALAADSECPA